MGAVACLTLALVHIFVWWKDRAARANLAFAATAGSGACPGTYGFRISESPATNEDHDVWFDFAELDPRVEDATTRTPLSSRADAVARYDQSPIDSIVRLLRHERRGPQLTKFYH